MLCGSGGVRRSWAEMRARRRVRDVDIGSGNWRERKSTLIGGYEKKRGGRACSIKVTGGVVVLGFARESVRQRFNG